MRTLKLLYKKNYLIFFNTYLESPKKRFKLVMLLLVLLVVFIGGSYLVSSKLFDPLSSDELENGKEIMQAMLFSFMLMFSVFQFYTSALSVVPDFYESADMQYLVSTPIKASTLLIYKLINHSLNVIKKESFIAFPLILATGFLTKPSLLFYVVMPLIYFFLVAASACFGIILGMILLNRMSVKKYKILMTIGQNLFIAIIWVLFVFRWIDVEKVMMFLEIPFVKNYLIYILPAYSASHIISEISFELTKTFFVNLPIFVGLVSLMIFSAGFVANKYFFSGWMSNSIMVTPKKYKKRIRKPGTGSFSKNRHPVICLLHSQWLMALKNSELLFPALMMYGVYGVGVYLFIRFATISFELRLVGLVVLGFFLVNLGTTMPLLNSKILKNPKLEKLQYTLFKTFPISPKHYLGYKLMVQGIPTIIIITFGLAIACIFTGISTLQILFLLLIQAILYTGYLIQNVSFLILYYQKYYDENKFIGNMISMGLSLIYYTLTFGIFLFTTLGWISLPLYLILGIAILYNALQFFVALPIGIRAWAKTEF